MIRKAFVMTVHAGKEEEYFRRHAQIWPELVQTLKRHGVHNYSIFLQAETRQLFAYLEIEDEDRLALVATTPECKRWWASMKPLMPTNPDDSPVSFPLKEAFHLD